MIREIKDASPKTQEPRPAPLGRAPVQFVLVVVVVRELGCGPFSIFVDVARRSAHCYVASAALEAECYVLRGWQARSDAFLAPRSSARITFAHSESNEDLRTTNAPAEQGKRNHSACHQICAALPAASLRVLSGTCGRRGAGKASAASSDRAS